MLPLGGMGEMFGGYKGYGYGILCELLSSVLAQGMTSNHVSIAGGGVSHGFISIDPALFGDRSAIRAHFSTFLQELRESSKAEGCTRIYTHGEKEIESYNRRMSEGIPVQPKTLEEMRAFCTYVGIRAEDYINESN
jgi:LDH2 family malate/lactate/ureidoglycolate dehydrogenase